MVLYCLTPPQFHRYSSLTLCPPRPAWGENSDGPNDKSIVFDSGGICLVNRRSLRFSGPEGSPPTETAVKDDMPPSTQALSDDWEEASIRARAAADTERAVEDSQP